MTIELIRIKMIELGISREWLAEKCDYKPATLANILAPGGSHKTDKALRRIAEVLEAEEILRKQTIFKPATLTNAVTLTPTVAQFDRWMKAAYTTHNSFDEWAKQGLDRMAEEEPTIRVAQEPNYRTKEK